MKYLVQPRWILVRDVAPPNNGIPWPDLCRSDCIARLLQRHNFKCADDVRAFLNPRLAALADPFLIGGMHDAVERIFHAIDHRQRVVLFGDYDVDGVTSLALLSEILRAYGNEPALFLPLRMEEGYGLSAEGVARCLHQHNPEVLIAIDCGTSSLAEIDSIKRAGIDVIVLDHHEPKSELPDCLLVNSKTTNSGFDYLCSVGLTFKLCHALLKTRRIDFDLKTALDLVALGTVASRISKKYYRPTIIVAFDESGAGKGSGHSIEGCSIVQALSECSGALEKFGGHEMAAGVNLREENLPKFREQFLDVVRQQLSDEGLGPRLHLDAEIALAEINFDLLHWHEMLQPFGNGNPQPIFVSSAVEAARPPRVVGERHLELRLRQRNWYQRAIFFDGAAAELPPAPWDVAFRIYTNVYEGETRIDLHVQALRSAASLD